MRSINSSYNRIIEQDILKRIELCGKVCYQSSHNIKEGSAEGFVKGICSRGHTSVLEHSPMYFIVKDKSFNILRAIRNYEDKTFDVVLPYMKYKHMEYGMLFVSTTPRVIYNLIIADKSKLSPSDKMDIDVFLSEVSSEYPEIFNLFPEVQEYIPYFEIKRSDCIVPELARETYNIVCDRKLCAVQKISELLES